MDTETSSAAHDSARQSVVILVGTLARHLGKTDPKVENGPCDMPPLVLPVSENLSLPCNELSIIISTSIFIQISICLYIGSLSSHMV